MAPPTSAEGHAALEAIGSLVAPKKSEERIGPRDLDQADDLDVIGRRARTGNGLGDRPKTYGESSPEVGAPSLIVLLEIVQKWQLLATRGGRAPSPKDNLNMLQRRNVQLAIKRVLSHDLLPACRVFVVSGVGGEDGGMYGKGAVDALGSFVQRLLRMVVVPPEQEKEEAGGREGEADMIDGQPIASTSTSPPFTTPTPVRVTPTILTTTLRSLSTLPLVLSATILLAWSQSFPPHVHVGTRKIVFDLLGEMSAPESISILGAALSFVRPRGREPTNTTGKPSSSSTIGSVHESRMPWPAYVTRTLRILMTRQILLRPRGIEGLMTNVFGTSMGSKDLLELHKLEHLVRVVGDWTAGREVGVAESGWWERVGRQLVEIVVPDGGDGRGKGKLRVLPERYAHAACFVLSQLVDSSPDGLGKLIRERIHGPFLPRVPTRLSDTDTIGSPIILSPPSSITNSLSLLLPLLTRVPPSSNLLSHLLTPIILPLFALHTALEQDPTADPLTRQELKDVLRSWGRLSREGEVVDRVARILEGGRGWGRADEGGNESFWQKTLGGESEGDDVDEEGFAVAYGRPPERLALHAQPSKGAEVRISTAGDQTSPREDTLEDDDDKTFSGMDIHPDPQKLVALIVSLERQSVAAGVFERCLVKYQTASEDPGQALRAVLHLQLVMVLSEKVGDKIFRDRPESTLLFIEQALRPSLTGGTSQVSRTVEDEDDDGDSDDEIDDPLDVEDILDIDDVTKLDLKETAISLLVAVVSAQDSGKTSLPILQVIEQHLKHLEHHGAARSRQLAQSANLVLAVYKAGEISGAKSKQTRQTDVASKYQEALNLLADPILPVRGHGLILLQDVVLAKNFDRALLPAILDIFLQAIKDEDSFMYLNAVKGLSNMVDGLGREVLQSVVREYSQSLDRIASVGGKELDRRLRLGEALVQCVRRAGQALSRYADVFVPPLLRIFPLSRLPTVLRASSLSILATSAETNYLALLPWLDDSISACLDLVQVESVATGPRRHSQAREQHTESPPSAREPVKADDGKHPALRRAALVLLGLAFDARARDREMISSNRSFLQESDDLAIRGSHLRTTNKDFRPDTDAFECSRAKTILGYVAGTDVDDLVRHQAAEALEILGRLMQ